MKKILITLFQVYCILGAIWLTFSIVAMLSFGKRTKHEVPGTVKEVIETEWNDYKEVNAIVETSDGKGSVLLTIYQPGIKEGDNVKVEISENESSSYIHSSIVR